MKHTFKLIALLFFQSICLIAFAQNRANKVESIKVAYLSEKLNLDPKTAERFWPVYNQYDDEMHTVIQESKRNNDNRSAEEILDQEQKAIDIKRRYSSLFLKVINNEQLSQLFQAEREFNRILLRRINKIEQRQQNMEGNQNERFRNRPRMDERTPGARENKMRQREASIENETQRRPNK